MLILLCVCLICTDARCSVIVWLWGLLRCSPVSVMDRLQQLIKACELWNLCGSSIRRGAASREREREREPIASRTCVSTRLLSSCCSHFLPSFFSEIETGAIEREREEDSHRTSHQSPVSVCVCSTFGFEHVWTQFKGRFPVPFTQIPSSWFTRCSL